jgi:hypothetical protein
MEPLPPRQPDHVKVQGGQLEKGQDQVCGQDRHLGDPLLISQGVEAEGQEGQVGDQDEALKHGQGANKDFEQAQGFLRKGKVRFCIFHEKGNSLGYVECFRTISIARKTTHPKMRRKRP